MKTAIFCAFVIAAVVKAMPSSAPKGNSDKNEFIEPTRYSVYGHTNEGDHMQEVTVFIDHEAQKFKQAFKVDGKLVEISVADGDYILHYNFEEEKC